jgi:spore maturation protein SpmB
MSMTTLCVSSPPTRSSRALPRTLYGSSETTFYVLAEYLGAVGVRRTRHAVPAALIADLVAAIAQW